MTSFDTLAVHAGDEPDPSTGALEPPIVLSSTFAFDDAEDAGARIAGEREGYVYGRWANPTVRAFEQKLTALEGAEDAVALASGMAAVHAALGALLEAGDHVIAPRSFYAESARLLSKYFARFGVQTSFVDMTRAEELQSYLRDRTRVVYVETPANPLLTITDLRAAAEIAHARGAKLVVDSTFATPYHQRPLALGADLVVHSATKALCGHGDAMGGVVAGSRELVSRVRELGTRMAGGVLSPMTAMLLSRGTRTLSVRMAKASASAMELAERLEEHPRIERVYYPGLTSHPGHRLAARQMERGYGALVAFDVRGGREAGARAYDRVQLIERAVSLGDVRSLLTHAASTTHASLSPADRAAAGIGEGLMRLSVGIEDVDDLWGDLDQALS